MFSSSLSALERLVAAARAQQVRIAREVRRRHQVDVQRRFVRVAVDPARVVLRRAPLAARQRLAALRTCRPSAADTRRCRPCASSCRAPSSRLFAFPSTLPFSRPYSFVTSSFVSARKSPFVSRMNQRLPRLADEHAADRAPSRRAAGSARPQTPSACPSSPSRFVSSSTTTLPIGSRFGSGACRSRTKPVISTTHRRPSRSQSMTVGS